LRARTPWRTLRAVDLHRLAEERSIALHRVVAERVRVDASIVTRARERLARRAAERVTHPHYAAAWRDLLDGPIDRLCAALVSGDEVMRALRQCTPFTFVVSPRERAAIWKRTRAELLGAEAL
jgi:hypothetical protein